MPKCLFRYQWVKLPRTHLPVGKGIMGSLTHWYLNRHFGMTGSSFLRLDIKTGQPLNQETALAACGYYILT